MFQCLQSDAQTDSITYLLCLLSPPPTPSACLPAKGPEKSPVCVEQTLLRHRRGSLPDHRQRLGLLPPDLPAGCGSGDWQEPQKTDILFNWSGHLNVLFVYLYTLKFILCLPSVCISPCSCTYWLASCVHSSKPWISLTVSSSSRSSALTWCPAALFCYSISELDVSTVHRPFKLKRWDH